MWRSVRRTEPGEQQAGVAESESVRAARLATGSREPRSVYGPRAGTRE